MNRVGLYRKYSIGQLVQMQQKIRDDPKSRNPNKDSIWIYNKPAHKKLDDIAWAITYHLADKRHVVIEG